MHLKGSNSEIARIVVDYYPQKEDENRVWIIVGGNLIDCLFELIT